MLVAMTEHTIMQGACICGGAASECVRVCIRMARWASAHGAGPNSAVPCHHVSVDICASVLVWQKEEVTLCCHIKTAGTIAAGVVQQAVGMAVHV